MTQVKELTVTMGVKSLMANQDDQLPENDLQLVVQDFLTNSISFPAYQFTGEVNGKTYDIQLIFVKGSSTVNNIVVSNV